MTRSQHRPDRDAHRGPSPVGRRLTLAQATHLDRSLRAAHRRHMNRYLGCFLCLHDVPRF